MEMNGTEGMMMSDGSTGMTNQIFDGNDATHKAVNSGAWTDPDTWEDGKVPAQGALVHIPMGIEVTYNATSNAKLDIVRVDGTLNFATDQDTNMIVESIYTGLMSTLTIGTAENPIHADVKTNIVFSDGPLDLSEDPEQLGHGLVAEGKVIIHGAEKSPYGTLDGNAMSGAKAITLESGTDGWVVGDTIVVMGTAYEKFQDEYREITAISEGPNGITITLDSALDHNHTTPDGHDLDIYVGNSTRNVEFSSENPEGVRGHVMMMHTPDVNIAFAEFTDLGRTDKGELLNETDNVAGRYSLHLHETGTEAGSDMAVLYGNSVHGSPGWGIVQHSSVAAIDYNFVHDIQGAGIVSEDGDETGQWIGNFVTGVTGHGEKFTIGRDELDADFGHSGVAFENQARQILQQDNIAANANTGWMFRAAETSADDPDRAAIDFDPMPFKSDFNHEEAAIIGFHDNEAIAVGTVIDTGHRQDASLSTDLRSDIIGLKAWEVDRVLDMFSYTGEYVIRDGLFIGRDGAGRAIKVPGKHEGTSIINTHFENFKNAISDDGLNNDAVYIGLTFKNIANKIQADYYGEERLQSYDDVDLLAKPIVTIDGSSDLTLGRKDDNLYISGTIKDSAGTIDIGSNRWTTTTSSDKDGIDIHSTKIGSPEPEELIAIHGAMRDGAGWIMPVALWVTDRVTGEHFAYRIDVELTGFEDSFLKQHEITSFDLPSGEITPLDSYQTLFAASAGVDNNSGDTSGGDTSGGDTSDVDTSDGNTSDVDTPDGDTSDGNTSGGDMNGGNTSGGDTLVPEAPNNIVWASFWSIISFTIADVFTKIFKQSVAADADGNLMQLTDLDSSTDQSGSFSSGDAAFALSELLVGTFEFIGSSADVQIELADMDIVQGTPIQVNLLFDIDVTIEQVGPPADDSNDLVLETADQFDLL